MGTLRAKHCRVVATTCVSLLLAAGVIAQEQQENTEQAQPSATPRTLYVSDKLVLNVYAEADQSSSRVATIETGDALEEIERLDNLVHVRLADGREGWVGANYLMREPPAAARLRELQREQKPAPQAPDRKSTEEIARLKKDKAALEAQVKELQARVAAVPTTPIQNDVDGLEGTRADDPSGTSLEAQATMSPLTAGATLLWLAVVAAGSGLGFAAGYQMLARRIRRKFGGLKIY